MTSAARRGSLRRDLNANTADGAAFSLMVGIGETYLPAFVLAVGLGEVLSGLSATVPMVIGAMLQLLAPTLIPRAGSHRRWVIACAALQALSLLPLAVGAWAGRISGPTVFLVAAVYWAAGLAASPAWNTWMSRAVPSALRARFFARRNWVSHVAVLVGLVSGGMALQWASHRGMFIRGFALLFLLAALARLVSVFFLYRQSEPRRMPAVQRRVPLAHIAGRLRQPEGRLIAYLLLAQFFTHWAAPYFNPFMLGELKLSYAPYMMLLGVAFLTKAIALPSMGRWAKRFGAKPLLWIGGVGIVPLPALWLLSQDTLYLMVLQIIGGVVWAAFEFASFLLLFETITDEERTGVLTAFNLLNAAAIALGSAFGGLLLGWMEAGREAYLFVFLASGVGRLLTLPLLGRVAEVPAMVTRIGFRSLAVRPSAGSLDRPIIATVAEGESLADSEAGEAQ